VRRSLQYLNGHVSGFVPSQRKIVAEDLDFEGVTQRRNAHQTNLDAWQQSKLKQALLKRGIAADVDHSGPTACFEIGKLGGSHDVSGFEEASQNAVLEFARQSKARPANADDGRIAPFNDANLFAHATSQFAEASRRCVVADDLNNLERSVVFTEDGKRGDQVGNHGELSEIPPPVLKLILNIAAGMDSARV